MEGGGFEPPKLARQIYSLIPLATREPLRKGAHSLDLDTLCQQPETGNSAPHHEPDRKSLGAVALAGMVRERCAWSPSIAPWRLLHEYRKSEPIADINACEFLDQGRSGAEPKPVTVKQRAPPPLEVTSRLSKSIGHSSDHVISRPTSADLEHHTPGRCHLPITAQCHIPSVTVFLNQTIAQCPAFART